MLVIPLTLFQICLCRVSGNDLMFSPEGYSVWLESSERINFEASLHLVDIMFIGLFGRSETNGA